MDSIKGEDVEICLRLFLFKKTSVMSSIFWRINVPGTFCIVKAKKLNIAELRFTFLTKSM